MQKTSDQPPRDPRGQFDLNVTQPMRGNDLRIESVESESRDQKQKVEFGEIKPVDYQPKKKKIRVKRYNNS